MFELPLFTVASFAVDSVAVRSWTGVSYALVDADRYWQPQVGSLLCGNAKSRQEWNSNMERAGLVGT